MPQFKARECDKLRYRYPHGGESCTDLIERLKPIIIELERYHTVRLGRALLQLTFE